MHCQAWKMTFSEFFFEVSSSALPLPKEYKMRSEVSKINQEFSVLEKQSAVDSNFKLVLQF